MEPPPVASTSAEPDTSESPPVPSVTLRRPVSSDAIRPTNASRHLRTASSSSSLSTGGSGSPKQRLYNRSSFTNLRRPVASKQWSQPTLAELMRAEEERMQSGKGDQDDASRDTFSRRNSADNRRGHGMRRQHGSLSSSDDDAGEDWAALWAEQSPPPQSAVLYPPLYGRPAPLPSPDIFSTLLQPILSLSRPSSPGPPSPAAPLPSSDEPADRSASSLPAHFPPRAESDPAPTVESQGFVLYVGSLVAYLLFLVWSLCPDELLVRMGFEWYPSREWALLVPAWTVTLVFFVYFSYAALNIFITPDLDSLHTLIDHAAYLLPLNPDAGPNTPHPLLAESVYLPEDAVPPLHDLPIGLVNRVVLGDFRRRRGKKFRVD